MTRHHGISTWQPRRCRDSHKKYLRDRSGPAQALHIASLWGNAQAVGVLVQAGADVNKPNEMGDRTPLHMVATRFEKGSAGGRLICAQYLIAAGADLTAKDTEGGMPWEYIVGEEAEAAELRKLLTPK